MRSGLSPGCGGGWLIGGWCGGRNECANIHLGDPQLAHLGDGNGRLVPWHRGGKRRLIIRFERLGCGAVRDEGELALPVGFMRRERYRSVFFPSFRRYYHINTGARQPAEIILLFFGTGVQVGTTFARGSRTERTPTRARGSSPRPKSSCAHPRPLSAAPRRRLIGSGLGQDVRGNHKIVENGYNIGRDLIVDKAIKGTRYLGRSWETSVVYVEGLLPPGSEGEFSDFFLSSGFGGGVKGLMMR